MHVCTNWGHRDNQPLLIDVLNSQHWRMQQQKFGVLSAICINSKWQMCLTLRTLTYCSVLYYCFLSCKIRTGFCVLKQCCLGSLASPGSRLRNIASLDVLFPCVLLLLFFLHVYMFRELIKTASSSMSFSGDCIMYSTLHCTFKKVFPWHEIRLFCSWLM